MKTLFMLFGFLVLFTAPAVAQDPPKIEVSGGYSLFFYSQASGTYLKMNGWTGSANYTIFKRWLSADADASGNYTNQGVSGKTSAYSLLIGPQFYPFGHRKLTLFGHVLFGAGYYYVSYPAYAGFPTSHYSDVADSWDVGTGLDLNLWKHWGIRLPQFDFQQTRFRSSSGGQGNYRVSVELTYRFGKK
jgi:hypothetical protein